MRRIPIFAALAAVITLLPAMAPAKQTVCTVTVNSDDEKETIRRRLPKGEYDFVELVEKGRPDWLRSSCQKHVQCDVLVISGHFNAGDTFYSDKIDRNEYLDVDELERASCGASCSSVFEHLKEVYLFGCESLNPDATKYSSSYGESGRDRMRRLFPNVPVIYGFYSSAPVGPTAAMLLDRYFDRGGASDFGTGRVSNRLMTVFGHNHIAHVSGVRPGEAAATYRHQVCQFFDERLSAADRLEYVHALFGNGANVSTFFERVEKLFGALTADQKQSPEFTQALAKLGADRDARARYIEVLRRADPPTRRARMIQLGTAIGWFTPAQERGEQVALVNDLLAKRTMGFAEVDLVCSLNASHALDAERGQLQATRASSGYIPHIATLACMGDESARQELMRSVASSSESDAQVVQTYLRYYPVTDRGQLRAMAREVSQASGPAQVRGIDAIGRLNISDREVLRELSTMFAQSHSLEVQRALAELFIRSDPAALPRPDLLGIVREHRIKPPHGGHDLVDTLLERLQPG